jgi:hypothetical protein
VHVLVVHVIMYIEPIFTTLSHSSARVTDGDIYSLIYMIWSTSVAVIYMTVPIYTYTHTNVYVVQYHKGKEVQRVRALSREHMHGV